MAVPKIIIIRGPICAGKTTTINLLKEKFTKASYIDFDSFKRAIDWTQPSDWRDKLAFKSALNLAEELMKRQRNILADIHSSKKYQYQAYKNLAAKYSYEFNSFLLYPPLHVCLCRNLNREIPDVKYSVTEQEIIDYWKNTFKIPAEDSFNTGTIKVEEIIDYIVKKVNKVYQAVPEAQ